MTVWILALFVDGPARLAGWKKNELDQHRLGGRRGGGDGIGHGIQIRNVGGGTRHVRSHIGWRFTSTLRGVRSHENCDRRVGGHTARVMIIIRKTWLLANPRPVVTKRSWIN